MRLDKFLKVSRLIKRRTLAKELASNGRVTVNGNKAKAGTELEVGDELTLQFGQKDVVVRVEELKDTTKKEASAGMYTVLSETPRNAED
ncbi:RNA-binding S4 domain-containing protein [Salsuginibacillus kocurii]|uniref:RNA-binding S4 domain-containing protein n=1 Tax=Salsuginibacillus kocurii TaxID=427078 RepID=UPI00037A7334|nr:RNA-binding S4 domain-containing protein [Salsuginibacillus kocurii]